MNKLRSRAFSLVEMLVVVVVIAVLAAILLPRYLSSGTTPGGKKVESPIKQAHGTECLNNLQQLRLAYQVATSSDENKPQSLRELRVPQSMLLCPVGKTPYQFDPASGRVWCTYPAHQNQ